MIRFVAFDMDGTLVDVPSSWGYVHSRFGDSNDEALALFLANQIDDEEFIRRDVQRWWRHRPSLTAEDLETILSDVPLMPGAPGLLDELHRRRVRTAIISGGLDLLARRVGRELGIDYVLANGVRVDDAGRLTGEGIVRVPINQKEAVLERVQRQLGFSRDETASVGNSEIDVGLFRRSQIGIAFLPQDTTVRSAASAIVEAKDLRNVLSHLGGVGPASPNSPPPRDSGP